MTPWRRQPLMRLDLSKVIRRSSVSRFPRERIADITAERFSLVKISPMNTIVE
jgi:hypothetical protein